MGVAIVAGARTPFVKMGSSLRNASAVDLGVGPVNTLIDKFNLAKNPDGLLVFGSVIQHSDVSNLAREIVFESKVHPQVRTFSTIMACATSVSSVAEAASWISTKTIPWAIAGGTESMSNFPLAFSKPFSKMVGDLKFSKTFGQKLAAILKLRPKHFLPSIPTVSERTTGLTMGEHCEQMVKEWKIPRADQDDWAVKSHQKAAAAEKWHAQFLCSTPGLKGALKDNLVRGDTTVEKAAKLKPSFTKDGTLTAANSSPLTDGGAAVLLADEDYAKKQGWPILALVEDFEKAAVDIRSEGLLMAPPYALLRMLERQGKKLSQFDILEIHEAFAAQVLCNLKALQTPEWCQARVGLPPTEIPSYDRINPKGGSIPLGHPFGATGARLFMQLAQQMADSGAKSGVISVCAAGGLGFVATLKR